MKVEITTLEIAELLNTIQGRTKVSQNPLGMSADDLIEKIADRVIQRIQETLEANQEEQEDEHDDLPTLISGAIDQNFAKLEENLAKLSAHDAGTWFDDHFGHLADTSKMVEPPEDGQAADEAPDVVTLGDTYETNRTSDPDYPNEIVSKKEEPAAPEEEPAKKVRSMPVWDESAGVYVVDGNGHIGRDLWNKDAYRAWFNDEIRRLRKDGKSPQYIADRIKVSAQTVRTRMMNYKID